MNKHHIQLNFLRIVNVSMGRRAEKREIHFENVGEKHNRLKFLMQSEWIQDKRLIRVFYWQDFGREVFFCLQTYAAFYPF